MPPLYPAAASWPRSAPQITPWKRWQTEPWTKCRLFVYGSDCALCPLWYAAIFNHLILQWIHNGSDWPDDKNKHEKLNEHTGFMSHLSLHPPFSFTLWQKIPVCYEKWYIYMSYICLSALLWKTRAILGQRPDDYVWWIRAQGGGILQQFQAGESDLCLLELFKVSLKACRHSEGLSFSFTANLLKWEETNMTTHRLHEPPLSGFYQEQNLSRR